MKKFTLYFLIAIVVTSLVALYKTTQHKELFQLQAVTGPQMLCAIRNGQAKPELVTGTGAFKKFVAAFNVTDATQKQATDPNYVRNLVCPTPKPGVVSNTTHCGPLSEMYRNKRARFTIKC